MPTVQSLSCIIFSLQYNIAISISTRGAFTMEIKVRFPYVLTDIFIYLVITVFLLFPGFHGYLTIQDEKSVLFYFFFGGYLILMALFSFEMILGGHLKFITPLAMWKKADWTQRFAVLYLLFSLISTIFSPYQSWAWTGMSRHEGMITISLYCIIFLCVSTFARPRNSFWTLFALSMIVFCVICLLQMAGFNPFSLYPSGLSYSDANELYAGIYLGTIGNADLAAALLCLSIPILISRVIDSHRKPDFIMIVALLLSIIVLIQMDVKAGLVGVFGGLWLALPLSLPVKASTRKYLWLLIFSGIVTALLFIYFVPSNGTLYEANQVLHGNWDDRFGSGRIYIWKQVLQQIPHQFFWGSGPDTMMAAGIAGFPFISESGQSFETFVDTAHNEFLNVLFHQGIFALISYVGILITCLAKWARSNRSTSTTSGLGCAIICYSVQSFFGLSMCMTSGIFWVILGLFEFTLNQDTKE